MELCKWCFADDVVWMMWLLLLYVLMMCLPGRMCDDVGMGGGGGGDNIVCAQSSRWTWFFFSRSHRFASVASASIQSRPGRTVRSCACSMSGCFSDELCNLTWHEPVKNHIAASGYAFSWEQVDAAIQQAPSTGESERKCWSQIQYQHASSWELTHLEEIDSFLGASNANQQDALQCQALWTD